MGCPSEAILGGEITFSINTAIMGQGPEAADALPTYDVLEMEGSEPIVEGTMSATSGVTGRYTDTLSVAASAGFEANKVYSVVITAILDGVTLRIDYQFLCLTAGVAYEHAGAAVAPAEVLAQVNSRLQRAETDIDVQLRAALKEITGMANFLAGLETPTLSEGDSAVDEPDDLKEMLSVWIGEDKVELTDEIPADVSGESPGQPEQWASWGDGIQFDRQADVDYTVTLRFWRFHPDDVGTILLGSQFREAIYSLTTAKVAHDLGLWEIADRHQRRYDVEMARLLGHTIPSFGRVRYRDL